MDRPQHDKRPEEAEVSPGSLSKPTAAREKSSMLPWFLGGAVALLVLYGNSDWANSSRNGRDALAERESSEQVVSDFSASTCSAWGKLAEQAMSFRQNGGSKADLLDVIDKSGNEEHRMLAHAIVDDAYSSALHSDPDLRAASILAFRAVVKDTCSNSG